MSAPEEIQSEIQAEPPMDVSAAVRQLRTLVCGLGAALIFVSLTLSAFVLKQNRDLTAVTNNREHQIAQLQATQKPMMYVLSELAKYSVGKPELTAIFTKHGLKYSPTGATGQPATTSQP
ncbi:MAG TPA: hypothetical protein VNL17_12930 [Verrucomicrobiae bacterium]|nr:hypothetical protein [Verrucomicrobiae bacterium]